MDSKRPWCSPRTCCWMPVECVAFVFSIINAVICSIWTLASISYVFLLINASDIQSKHHYLEEPLVFFLIIVNFIGSVVAMVFAVLLCVGLSKKKPQYVLAYLVYGLFSVTLSVLGTMGTFGKAISISPSGDIPAITTVMFACLLCYTIYIGILALVYQSYKVLSGRAPVTEHTRFQDTEAGSISNHV